MDFAINTIDDNLVNTNIYYGGEIYSMYTIEELLDRVVTKMEDKIDSLSDSVGKLSTAVEILSRDLRNHISMEESDLNVLRDDMSLYQDNLNEHRVEEKKTIKKATIIIIAAFAIIATAGTSALLYFAPGLFKVLIHLIAL